jgi:hypothetical protein
MTMDNSPQTHTRRLRKLADILENLQSDRRFNMGTWGEHGLEHHPDENFCGTTACALGHAAMDPEFRRDGLSLEWERNENGYRAAVVLKDHDELRGAAAGAEFFGLTQNEASFVFYAIDESKYTIIRKLRALADDRAELRTQYWASQISAVRT